MPSAAPHVEQRADEGGLREHGDGQRHRQQQLLARELEPGDGVGGEHGDDHRQQRGDDRDAERVAQRRGEQRVAEHRCRSCPRTSPPGRTSASRCGTCSGSLNDSDTIHSSGNSAHSEDEQAPDRPPVAGLAAARHQVVPPHLGQIGLEALDEDEGDDHDREEQQHRHRRAGAQVHQRDVLAVGQERQRLGVVGAAGHDERVVEDAPRVERAEQQGDHDRRLHVGQRHLPQPLPRRGAVDLGRLLQLHRAPGPARPAAAAR